MTKTKRIAILIVAVLLCGTIIGVVLAICVNNNEPTKYDIAIKVVCKEVVDNRIVGPILGVWVFAPDVSEITIEREYDGKQYTFFVEAYNLPDHPDRSEAWLSPLGDNVFEDSLWKSGTMAGDPGPKYVCEKGEYCYRAYASRHTNLWNARAIKLFISVI